jgi:dihydrofolate reductase
MGRVICAGLMSLDGYIADGQGNFDWAAPDNEVHSFINDLQRSVGTFLYGRRMYEVLKVWQTLDVRGEPEAMQDYANLWRAADKVVYSTELTSVSTPRTRLERHFEPTSLVALKESTERDTAIAGPGLAAGAIRAGMVDEYQLFIFPVVVGAGTRFFPTDAQLELELSEQRVFADGVLFLRYTSCAKKE